MLRRRIARSKQWRSRPLLCSALLILISGCQPLGLDTPFAAHVGETAPGPSAAFPGAPPKPPIVVDLQLHVPLKTLDTLNLVGLSRCAVQTTVGKHRSSLGRYAKPSQRLLIELEYLRLAPACINLLRENHSILSRSLNAIWRHKRQQLPALIFNATLASDEYRSFWLSTRPLGGYPPVSHALAVTALRHINQHICRWLNGDYQTHNLDFEVLLSEVAGGGAGTLMHAIRVQSNAPDSATSAIARLHMLLMPIKILETQLVRVLPKQYRLWMDDRNARVTAPALRQGERSLLICIL